MKVVKDIGMALRCLQTFKFHGEVALHDSVNGHFFKIIKSSRINRPKIAIAKGSIAVSEFSNSCNRFVIHD